MFNLLFLTLLLIRFWRLDLKPPHHDETINGWFVTQLWQTGNFHYDPTNYHGPLLFWIFQLAESLGGWGVTTLRFVTVLFSCMTLVWMILWARDRFHLKGWWAIALLLSPGLLFFSRSAIHESAFVFFTIMAATGWIDAWCLNRQKGLQIFSYGLTGALLLKETFAIPLALGVLLSGPLLLRQEKWRLFRPEIKNLAFHLSVCLFLWAFFYSSGFRKPSGLGQFFVAFLPWLKTGVAGHGHEKSFWYFWELILRYEWATFLALIVTAFGVFLKSWVRGLCLWSIGILLVYSLIPYKTPWCLISIQLPIWLSAVGVLAKGPAMAVRFTQVVLLTLGVIAANEWFTWNFEAVPRPHPYVYVQTFDEAKTFADSLLQQAKDRPEIRRAKVQFATSEPWPFPWWLQIYSKQMSIPFAREMILDPDVILVDEPDSGAAEEKLKGDYWRAAFRVRDSRVRAVAFLRKELFQCPFQNCEEVQR